MKVYKKFILSCLFTLIIPVNVNAAADGYIYFSTSQKYLRHLNQGYIAMENLNYPLALKEFMTARYIDDNLFAAFDGLGRVYELTHNYPEALNAYQKALDLISPKYADDIIREIKDARRRNETRIALGLYKIVLSIRPEAGLQVMYGDKNKHDGNWQKALSNYQRAYDLQENPDNYLRYLKVKYTNKEYEHYIIFKYIQKSLHYPEAHFKAGLINYEKGSYSRAIDEFSIATKQVTVPSAENKYQSYLAQAYYRQGTAFSEPQVSSLNKAISLFEKNLNNNPNDVSSLFHLADAYFYKDVAKMNSFNKDVDDAEKRFNNVSESAQNDPEYIDNRNDLNDALSKKYNPAFFDKTLEILKRIENLNKFDPGLYYSLGNVYLKKAIIYHKGYYDRYKYMTYEKQTARSKAWGFYSKALDEYKKYINRNPGNNGLIYYDIGYTYYQSSKLDPDKEHLPLTAENIKEYERWGAKFFRRDMLTHSIANFRKYLNYYPGAKNAPEVNNLIKEMQLAMVALW